MSFLDTLKEKFKKRDDQAVYLSGFKKTKDSMGQKLNDMAYKYKGINDEFLEELTIVLLESDVGIETADEICERLKRKAQQYSTITFRYAMSFLMEILQDLYNETPSPELEYPHEINVIFLVGVNGSGKTTSCAKLIRYFKDQGKSVGVVAADTFRAGAIDQLARWADKLGVTCIKGKEQSDPSSVLVDGCRWAKENKIDILLCDTAGRLQNKQNLMNELAKMHRVVGREIEGAPHHVWLVLDSTTGQNGLSQAKIFQEATNVSGIILSKMDGTAKGGIVLAIKNILHIPVYFIGLGEKETDLRPFDLDSYLYSISEGIQHVQ
ncbi:signal recognition particle-docking protein FtsY [Anaerorhabdus furcosa]|uniref:Signal recognition particle receptor FtsY n=1 Tax=Anaerorhabdus furcosa TaxID=118967 RepID=A0A1T4PI68_9FIRM|nr:signal recognition particle-docking protein FtsY [Anaerorhabdus furcosa]SJZ90528.1 fused signal recognition particle receptor [Anaerorhabdus furcosa]